MRCCLQVSSSRLNAFLSLGPSANSFPGPGAPANNSPHHPLLYPGSRCNDLYPWIGCGLNNPLSASQPPAMTPDPVSPTATAYAPPAASQPPADAPPDPSLPASPRQPPTDSDPLEDDPFDGDPLPYNCNDLDYDTAYMCLVNTRHQLHELVDYPPPATPILRSPMRDTSAGSTPRRPYSPPELPYASPAPT